MRAARRRSLLVVALLLCTGSARAAETEESLLEAMDADLKRLAAALDAYDAQPDTLRLTQAHNANGELERGLASLKRLGASSAKGKDRLSDWPAATVAVHPLLESLRTLKEIQYTADPAPEQCKKMTAYLERQIKEILRQSSVDDEDDLRAEGKRVGPAIQRTLDGYEAKQKQSESLVADVVGFRAPSEWRAVTEAAQGSAKAIGAYIRSATLAARSACNRLALGEKNPDIVDAIQHAKDTLGAYEETFDRWSADVDRWNAQYEELHKWYDAGTGVIIDAICDIDDEPYTSVLAEEAVYDAADRVREKLATRWEQLDHSAKELLARAAKVFKDDRKLDDAELKKKAEKARVQLDKRRKSAEKSFTKGLFLGSKNPLIRARMELGKKKHEEAQRSCYASEIEIPDKRMRMDCVNLRGAMCEIVEIKPDTPKAKARGETQVKGYVTAIYDLWKRDRPAFDKSKGLEVFKKCVDGSGKLKLGPRVLRYPICERNLELGTYEWD